MRPFLWKIVICLTPTLLSVAVCLIALWNYSNPPMQVGDYEVLSGLEYKLGVDLVGGTILVYEVDKSKMPANFEHDKLVAALKRRLDPADLYNITIRAVPGDPPRVEIILPTGGRHKRAAEDEVWNGVLEKARSEFNLKDARVDASPGNETALLLEIRRLTRPSEQDVKAELAKSFDAKETDQDKRKEAWQKALDQVKARWNLSKLDVTTVGDEAAVVAQVQEQAKPTTEDIQKFIDDNWKSSARKRNFTGDEVERIKELIQRVGSLEFVILANARDDTAAYEAAIRYISDPKNREELRQRSLEGAPPPMPPGPEDGAYKVTLHGETYFHTYQWVEVGKNELHSLNLNNAVENDTTLIGEKGKQRPKNTLWQAVAAARQGGAGLYPMDGSLLYSRQIENPARLAEKDRDKRYDYFFLVRNNRKGEEVTGEFLVSAGDTTDKRNKLAVQFRFSAEGATRFYNLTYKNRPDAGESGFMRQLAVVLDGQVMSAPRLEAVIRDSGIISGGEKGFERREVDRLVTILRSGALPATLKPTPVSENTMGSTLGDDTVKAGTMSVVLAFVAVLIFMVIYYRVAGVVACVALLANLFITLAFMVCVNATFTLPGLAGLVLMLAMAVDANVLIYERIREEADRGASLALSIRNGYDRALPTVLDTHLTSIFTAIVLYVVGNDQLKGFGISLTAGLLISLFTSLYMTRVMFDIALAKRWVTKLTMMRLMTKTAIPFMAWRKPVFTAAVATAGLGLLLFLGRGTDALNIDFVGGTKYSGELRADDSAPNQGMMNVSELRDLLGDEDRNRARLALAGEPTQVGPNRFELVYKDDNKKRTVTVLGEGAATVTPAEVAERAQNFEVSSVEPLYASDPAITQGDRSRLFTVRSREKSRDLVEASIIRLIGDRMKQTELAGATVSRVQVQFPTKLTEAEAKAALEPALKAEMLSIKSLAAYEDLAADKRATEALPGTLLILNEQPALATLNKALAAVKVGDKPLERISAAGFSLTLTDFAYLSQVQGLLRSQLQDLQVLGDRETLTVTRKQGTEEQENRFKEFEILLPGPIATDKLEAAVAGFKREMAARPYPVAIENFDKVLAGETQTRALYAILASWGAILLYLWFRFGNWTFGLAAVLCLIHDVCFTLGAIALCHYFYGVPGLGYLLQLSDFKLDLAAIASLLTLIGYSVNDTIVVFDRIREVRGKNPHLTPGMIDESANGTLSRTVLTSVITLLTVGVLYFFGGEGVHLFAFVMVIGVIVGTFSSIFVASPLLLMFGEGGAVKEKAPVTTPAVAER